MVDTNTRTIGWNDFHIQLIDLPEFFCLCGCRSRHAADRRIERDQVLHGDGSKDPSLLLWGEILFRFDRGVQTRRPSAILNDAAFRLIDRLDRTISDQIVHIASNQGMGMQGILDRRKECETFLFEKIPAAERAFCDRDSQVCERGVSAVLVDSKFHPAPKMARHAVYTIRKRRVVACIAGNDEGMTSL